MRACSAWLETGQLCVKIENYSGAIGSADPTNSLSTNAYITDESGTIVYADTNTSVIGNNTASDYGSLRGTYYYTYDTDFNITFNIEAGIRDNDGEYGNGTCGVTVTIGSKPSSEESDDGKKSAVASVQNLYIKISGAWHPILWG